MYSNYLFNIIIIVITVVIIIIRPLTLLPGTALELQALGCQGRPQEGGHGPRAQSSSMWVFK